MAAGFRVDEARAWVVVTLSGTPTAAELDALARSITDHPPGEAVRGVLVDATALRTRRLSTQSVAERAAMARPAFPVAVAASSDAAYGLARMFQMLGEGRGGELAVFRSVSEAERWLEKVA